MTYKQAVLGDTPLGYWPLDDQDDSTFLADLSGHNYTGSIVGSLRLEQPGATALLGPGAYFDSYRAYITVPGLDGHLPVGGEPYSIECWAGNAWPGSSGTFVFWGDFANVFSGDNSFNALFNDGLGNLRAAWAGNFSAWTNSLVAPVDFETGWHHVVVTCDGTTDALYVDGTQVATRSVSYSAFLGHNFIIGSFPVGTVMFGGLQHVAVYAHALPHESVARHYALGFPYQGSVLADSPAAYWPLSESSGPTYADIAGHSYDLSAPSDPQPGVAGPFASWTELSRSTWTASDSTGSGGAYTPVHALDDDLGTAWVSATNQVPGMWFSVDMGSAQDVSRIRMQASGDPGQFPAQFDLQVSTDGALWTTVGSGSGDTSAVLTLEFPLQHVRFLRVQTTAAAAHWWAIGEFRADVSTNLAVRFRASGALGGAESGLDTHPPLTVDGWIKMDVASDPRAYRYMPLLTWGDPLFYVSYTNPAINDGMMILLTTGPATGLIVSLSNSADGNALYDYSAPGLADAWHHVCVTMDGSGLVTAYRDGVSIPTFSLALATLPSPGSGVFYIGGAPGQGRVAWGDMAYVALYPSVLSGSRITAHAAGGVTTAAYQSAVLADSPLAYWKLDDAAGSSTVADTSTHGRTGTVHGPLVLGATTLDGPGPTAFFPDNDAAYVSFSPTGLPTTTAYSLEAWIKPLATGHSQRTMIAYGTQGPTNHVNWWMVSDPGGPGDSLDNLWGSNDYNHAVSPLEDAWHHCVVTWNGTTRTIYLDGVSLGTQASSGMNVDLSGGGMLGRALNGLNQMDGHMAHVAVYGSALSSGRVAAHYAAFSRATDASYRAAVLADNPSGFWPLQET